MGLKSSDPEKVSPGGVIGRIALGQGLAWVRSAVGLPILGIGGVMLALCWHAAQPRLSAWYAGIVADSRAQAQVVGARFVCETAEAKQVSYGLAHVLPGESGCLLREQVELRFLDASGSEHLVLATNPADGFKPSFLTPKSTPGPFQQALPLVNARTLVEPEAVAPLESFRTEHEDLTGRTPPHTREWNQLEALRTRMDDVLLFTAFSWLRPAPEAPVELRYAARDPERAWLGAFLGHPSWNRIPAGLVLVLTPVALWVLHLAGLIFVGSMHRFAPAAFVTVAVLSVPWWGQRIFELMAHFADRNETVAGIREDFGILTLANDGRVEPASDAALQPLPPDPAEAALQQAALNGLIPPRPARQFADLGEAFDGLCATVGERLAALSESERDQRYTASYQLLEYGINGPAWCLAPAALKVLDDADAAQRTVPSREFVFIATINMMPRGGSWFVDDYVAARKLKERVAAAYLRDERRR